MDLSIFEIILIFDFSSSILRGNILERPNKVSVSKNNEILDDDWKAKLPTSPAALEQMVIMDEYWLGHNLDKGQMLVERFIEATATTD